MFSLSLLSHVFSCSPLCYSSDRQLSFDLVNVGRQRLDFLPMLEHSGTYHETAMHTGTFAQEIITLVHHVKEQYFRDSGVTLNQRFSAPQEGSYSEETEELTLDQRFTSNRYPVRGPGDLRHDLERRRQERLEGVRVTISGNMTVSLRLLVRWSEHAAGEQGENLKSLLQQLFLLNLTPVTRIPSAPTATRSSLSSSGGRQGVRGGSRRLKVEMPPPCSPP
uniref:Uncharacterized protein n=1 Tax=Mola mola TaxID=94237 RepID=A0A3Q4BE25_MOLML